MARSKNKRQRKKPKINQNLTSVNQTSVLSQSQKRRRNRSKKQNKSCTKKTVEHLLLETLNNTLVANKSSNSHQSMSIIEISPEKIQTIRYRNDSNLHSESDCEIIEQVTPLIVLDDDCLNESREQSSRSNIQKEEMIKNTINSIDASDIIVPNATVNKKNSLSLNLSNEQELNTKTGELATESNLYSSEEMQWFFEDKTPGTNSAVPIYEINRASSSNNNQNMVKNFQITFQNKENNAHFDNSFAPNPLLSSTHLKSCHEMEMSSETSSNHASSSPKPTNICISINSTGVNDISRRVSIGNTSAASLQITNGSHENAKKINKRKAANETEKDKPPPSKRQSYNKPSDIIVLNDTISDEDDSVIFVSETLDQRTNNFIPLSGDNANWNGSKSTRAKRMQERKKSKKNRRLQAFISNKISKLQENKINRFAPNILNESVNTLTSSSPLTLLPSTSATATATITSAIASEKGSAKTKIILDYEKEKKLFSEKPELFEKRVIIIDGSNVAYAHGEAIGKSGLYSVKGLELCMKYFEDLGHIVRIVIPSYRIARSSSLLRIEKTGKLIKSPCKNLPGQRSISYDDRIILQSAQLKNGAIISNDNYADLLNENDAWDEIIKQRVIGFSWCDDFLVIPDDPYGRNGKTKELILHKLKDANIDDINKDGKPKFQ